MFALTVGCMLAHQIISEPVVALHKRENITQSQSTPLLFNQDFSSGFNSWRTEGQNPPKVEVTSTTSGPFKNLSKITVNSQGSEPWACQIAQSINSPLSKGDVVYLRIWLRRTGPALTTNLVFEESTPPNRKEIYESVIPTTEWQEFKIATSIERDYAPKASQFKLFFTGKGTIEVGPVSLTNLGKADISRLEVNLGKESYIKDQAWKDEANAKIKSLRMGNLTIKVVDEKGKPVKSGVPVSVNQTGHKFKFGTAAPARLLIDPSEDGQKFREIITSHFNTVTFENDLKWYKDDPNKFEKLIFPASNWLEKNKIQLRGHNLIWGSYRNSQMLDKNLSSEETWKQIESHVREYTTKMKGRVYLWDAVNEAVSETDVWEKVGWDKFPEVFKIASSIDPHAELCYNDYNISTVERFRNGAIARVKQIQKAGAKITVFGDQEHLSAPGVSPRMLWKTWDQVSKETGLPIEVTEFDFGSKNDQLQADYMEDFYRAAFSHPSVDAIIIWGFWENAHWLANRGGHLINKDWSWRTSMKVVDQLLNHEWRTIESLKTNSKGEVTLPAFYGSYDIGSGKSKVQVAHLNSGTQMTLKLNQR